VDSEHGGILFLSGRLSLLPFAKPGVVALVVFAENRVAGRYRLSRYDPVAFAASMRMYHLDERWRADQYMYRGGPPPEPQLVPGHDMGTESLRYRDIALACVGSGDVAAAQRLMLDLDGRVSADLVSAPMRRWAGMRLRRGSEDSKIVALWRRLWNVRLSDHATVIEAQLRETTLFGPASKRDIIARLKGVRIGTDVVRG
jgi:hypothetical protein